MTEGLSIGRCPFPPSVPHYCRTPPYCSDYPHSEGTATPLADYAAGGLDARAGAAPDLFGDNIAFLLRKH